MATVVMICAQYRVPARLHIFQAVKKRWPGRKFGNIGEADRRAGNQHESLRGVREAEIADREPLVDRARYVVDEDRQQCQGPQDVDPGVSSFFHGGGRMNWFAGRIV
nr:hypothetical protein [Mesorhizobium sp. SP-1A]